VLKNKIGKKNSIKKRTPKNNSGKPGLTRQPRDSSHEMEIISSKADRNKSQNLILNQPNVK
jgi:hypothetical protein